MSDEFDAIIAEGLAAPAQPETKDAPEETPTGTEVETPEPAASDEDKPEEMFPKKAVNALSRRDKQIGKLKAEKQQMRQELEELRQKAAPKAEVKDESPKEDDFETYGEYLRAEARFAAKQELRETQKQQTETKAKADADEWEEDRRIAIEENHQEALKTFSDFKTLLDDNSDDKGQISLSPAARRALLESDNGAFALHSILKNGALDELNQLSATKAAMLVARHEDKAIAASKKQTTKAPTPMTPSKGVASNSKSLDRMSPDELHKWVYS